MTCWAIAIRFPLSAHIYAINLLEKKLAPKSKWKAASHITGRRKMRREGRGSGKKWGSKDTVGTKRGSKWANKSRGCGPERHTAQAKAKQTKRKLHCTLVEREGGREGELRTVEINLGPEGAEGPTFPIQNKFLRGDTDTVRKEILGPFSLNSYFKFLFSRKRKNAKTNLN